MPSNTEVGAAALLTFINANGAVSDAAPFIKILACQRDTREDKRHQRYRPIDDPSRRVEPFGKRGQLCSMLFLPVSPLVVVR